MHPWAIRLPTIAFIMTSLLPIGSAQANSASDANPEGVLRQEIIVDLRSPLDGRPLTATEYAELQAEIDRLNEVPPKVAPKLRRLVGLLKLRKFIKRVLPIVPMK